MSVTESRGKPRESPTTRRIPHQAARGPKKRRPSPANRMARFKFAFEDKIPGDIWREIDELPLGMRSNLLAKSFSRGLLPLHDEKGDKDRFVVYLEGDVPKHFGKISGDKVMSKWGRGRILNHSLWEVPLTYGNNVKYSTGDVDCSVLKDVLEGLKRRKHQRKDRGPQVS